MRRPVALGLAAVAFPAAALAAFERPALSPESAAAGGLVALSEDPVFGNPAAFRPGLDLRASRGRPFGLPELEEVQAGAAHAGRFALGIGVRRFGTDAYTEGEGRITGAWEVDGAVSVGAALRGLTVQGSGFAPRRTAALDLAVVGRIEAGTVLGAVVEAVLGDVPGDPGGHLRRTALGVAREMPARLRLHLEMQRREDRPIGGILGLAWSPVAPLQVRVGLREEPRAVSWGFTVRLASSALSVSAAHADPLGRTVRVGLSAARP